MAMSTAASAAASSAAAPLSLLLRSSSAAAALRLSSVRAAPLSLLRPSAAVRSPRLAAAFSSSAQPRRVISVSVSAASAATPPLADLSQSAGHSRSLSTKQVGSSHAAPLRDQSSASVSSLFRPSSVSSTGLSSTHFSAAAFAHAARGITTRAFPSKIPRKSDSALSSPDALVVSPPPDDSDEPSVVSAQPLPPLDETDRLFIQLLDRPTSGTLNKVIGAAFENGYSDLIDAHLNRPRPHSNPDEAMRRLQFIEQTQYDPLVSALLESLWNTKIMLGPHGLSHRDCEWGLHRVALLLADVALWMPATPTTRALWLWFGFPVFSPSSLDLMSVESEARVTAAIERLRTIRDPKARMLRNCLLAAEAACRAASVKQDLVGPVRALESRLSVLSLLLPLPRAWRWNPDKPLLSTLRQYYYLCFVTGLVSGLIVRI